MRLLLDTNVILDVLLDRPPHVAHSSEVLAAVELGQATGFVGATSITTIHYGADMPVLSPEELVAVLVARESGV